MLFRLTYEGPVYSRQDRKPDALKPRASEHQHSIRRHFHGQLKRLWTTDKFLSKAITSEDLVEPGKKVALYESAARQNTQYGYRWAPLVRSKHHLVATLRVLFLRRDGPGSLYTAGDIDNRMKTVLDALCKPQNPNQVPYPPGPDEDPFFVLMEDDKLITHLEVETDLLLDPPTDAVDDLSRAKLVINVDVSPSYVTMFNLSMLG